VTDRTALEARPADDGSVFLDVGPGDRAYLSPLKLPGLLLRPRHGPGEIDGDSPFLSGLWLASRPRAFLENLRPSRARSGVRRTLDRAELEDRLERLLTTGGEPALNHLRDQARELAPKLDAQREFEELNKLIGALLGTREAELTGASARARQDGVPYDSARIELFGALHSELLSGERITRPSATGQPSAVFAFYEAYFSNYIEGTEFELEEAEAIVFAGQIPQGRPEDAHDIIGTFRLVNDPIANRRVPTSADDLIAVLQAQHSQMLSERPDVRPGQFKERPNRAGDTVFVAPELVRGTLTRGYEYYATLPAGFARAVFVMFLVSEVHPFDDGNGRIARVMMNSELTAVSEQRVIVPTVYRDDYLQALRALSRGGRAEPIVRVIDFAQQHAAAIDWSELNIARSELAATHAFEEPDGAARLKLP